MSSLSPIFTYIPTFYRFPSALCMPSFTELYTIFPLWLEGQFYYEVTMEAAIVRTARIWTHHAISFLLCIHLSILLSSVVVFAAPFPLRFLFGIPAAFTRFYFSLSLFTSLFSFVFFSKCPYFTCHLGVNLHWLPLLFLSRDWLLCYFGSSE